MVAIKLLGEQFMNIYIEKKRITLTSSESRIVKRTIKSDIRQVWEFVTQGKRFQLKNPSLAKQLVKKYSGDKADETID